MNNQVTRIPASQPSLFTEAPSINGRGSSRIKIGVILISFAILTQACVPPQLVILPLLMVAILVGIVALGIVLIALGSNRPTLRAEGLFLLALELLYIIGYLVPIMMAWVLPEGSAAAYIETLLIAVISALVVAGAAWRFRKLDPAFLKPGYAALFGFLLFFLINFGYYIAVSQFATYKTSADIPGLWDIVISDRVWGQLPYISFLLAPAGVALAWFVDAKFRDNPWPPDRLVRINLWVLLAVQVGLIVFVVIMRVQKMASPTLGIDLSGMSTTDVSRSKDIYLILSNFRADLFLVSAHDLLVAVALTVGVIAMNAKARLNKIRNAIAIGGAAIAVMLAFLPFYIGQKASVDRFISDSGGSYVENEKRREEFMAVRGLYPKSTSLTHLLISLTAGGALAFSLNLTGVRLKLEG